MTMQSQDIVRRSATNDLTPAAHARDHKDEVAKIVLAGESDEGAEHGGSGEASAAPLETRGRDDEAHP